MLFCLLDFAYKRSLAVNRKVFLSRTFTLPQLVTFLVFHTVLLSHKLGQRCAYQQLVCLFVVLCLFCLSNPFMAVLSASCLLFFILGRCCFGWVCVGWYYLFIYSCWLFFFFFFLCVLCVMLCCCCCCCCCCC